MGDSDAGNTDSGMCMFWQVHFLEKAQVQGLRSGNRWFPSRRISIGHLVEIYRDFLLTGSGAGLQVFLVSRVVSALSRSDLILLSCPFPPGMLNTSCVSISNAWAYKYVRTFCQPRETRRDRMDPLDRRYVGEMAPRESTDIATLQVVEQR
jgi:hypothetical protein